jgi:hypothetical protein
MEGEETYSPAEASKVLGRSGRKISERRIRQMLQAGDLKGERAKRQRLAECLEAEQGRGFWSRLFGR